jgi:hypothetical protein
MISRRVAGHRGLAAALLMAGCSTNSGGGGPAPVIASFTADAAIVAPGHSTALRWSVTNATSLSVDHGVGPVSGASVVVTPVDTTSYTLTATGAGGSTTATTTVTVRAPAPVIASFTATPLSIASGSATTLSWVVTNAASLSIDHDVGDVTGRSSVLASPTADTTYTLTANGPGGRATQSVSVGVHSPFLHVQYDDPPASAGKLRLVRNASSTATHLVLDLQVGGNPVSGFGIALSLPIDAAKVTFTPGSGLVVNATVLDAGSAPSTAAATLPLTGPLGNMLVVGVARKKQVVTDGDILLPASATVFSIALDMNGAPATGVIFSGSNLETRFRAALLDKAGAEVVSKQDFAIGDLSIAL